MNNLARLALLLVALAAAGWMTQRLTPGMAQKTGEAAVAMEEEGHEHEHEHEHGNGNGVDYDGDPDPDPEHGHEHEHGNGNGNGNGVDYDGDPDPDPEHGHEHEHEHEHEHGDEDDDDQGQVRSEPASGGAVAGKMEGRIRLAKAGPGTLRLERRAPGVVTLNEDRKAHLAPPFPGIVRRVFKSLGDSVRAGEILAWIESTELGEAKVQYLKLANEMDGALIDHARAEEVHAGTVKFLAFLEKSPALEALREMEAGPMGEYRGRLVEAYAELVFTRDAYERERGLMERGIASREDFLRAEGAYKKADATYAAARESAAFEARRTLLEEQRNRRGLELEWKAAERRLYVLGLSREDVRTLETMARAPLEFVVGAGSAGRHVCDDPDCANCREAAAGCLDPLCEGEAGGLAAGHGALDHQAALPNLSADERLSWYPLRAPFDGVVVEKHITLGERLDEGSVPFMIADLSTVWVDVSFPPRDLAHVRAGAAVTVASEETGQSAEARIAAVLPAVGGETRTAVARVVLPNGDGRWRPGLFVSAFLAVDEAEAAVLVPRGAVQSFDGETVLFVEDAHGLEARPVRLGRASSTHAEILAGLRAGETYVAEGAFELKAEQVTSGLDPHAGHGH